MSTKIHCENVSKKYNDVTVINNISFQIKEGEFISIVGRSGSGKSTLLKIIAGIEKASQGTINSFEGTKKGMVFQEDSVFPWRTVENNIGFALEVQGIEKKKRHSIILEIAKIVGIPKSYLEKYPKELSGGEKRRVAIGMLLAAKANILLFDEPTAQLYYLARLNMVEEIEKIWLKEKFSAVYVTHDIEEAIQIADRVLVLKNGRVSKEFTVKLARPRKKSLLASKQFISIKSNILQEFEK